MINALVVDDEAIIAEDLAVQLDQREGWGADFHTDPACVMKYLENNHIDVCFLDIEMPGQNGLSLARSIRQGYPDVHIIFATAYAQHAAMAYRLPASDYLVKPVMPALLDEACCRIEKLVVAHASEAGKTVRSKKGLVAVKSVGRTDYIKAADIVMCQAAGNYVRLYCPEKEYLHRSTFGEFLNQIELDGFVRCHRSFIVNAAKVTSFVSNKSGGDELVLDGGLKAPISQSYRKSIDAQLSGAAEKG